MPEFKTSHSSVIQYPSLSVASLAIGAVIFVLSQIPLFPAWLSGFFLYSAFYCVIDDVLAWPIMLMVGIPFVFLSQEMCKRHKIICIAACGGAVLGIGLNTFLFSVDHHPLQVVVAFVRDDFEMGLAIYGALVLLGIAFMYYVNKILLSNRLASTWSLIGMFLGNAASYIFPDAWCMNPLWLDLLFISTILPAFSCAVVAKIICRSVLSNYVRLCWLRLKHTVGQSGGYARLMKKSAVDKALCS